MREEDIPDNIEGGPYRPTPEDFHPSPPKEVEPLGKFPPLHTSWPAISLWLMFFVFSIPYWQKIPQAQNFWVSNKSILVDGEYWRLFTALFTHSGIDHLAANTLLFVIFGTLLRAFFGAFTFPFVSILLGAVTNFLTVLDYEPNIRLVGASGMVYAMVALWLVFYIWFDRRYLWSTRFARGIAFTLVVMAPTTFDPSTSYLAHAYGFGVGLLAGIVLIPFQKVLSYDEEHKKEDHINQQTH